jgi:hypothetical protein
MSIASETRKRLPQLEAMIVAMVVAMESELEKAQESYDSKSEKWQESPRGEFVSEQISGFESALDSIRNAFDELQGVQLEFEG